MNTNGKLVIDHSAAGENRYTLTLTGDLDVQTAPKLRRFINGMIREGKNNLILDLGNLSYLDSSGYGVIVDATRKTRATRGSLDIANMPSWIEEFFDLSVLETP